MAIRRIVLSIAGCAGLVASAMSVDPGVARTPDQLPTPSWTALPESPGHTESTYVDGRGRVHYKFDPAQLPDSALALDKGVRSKDGCTFSASGSGAPSAEQQVTRVIEIEFDPASCTRTLAVATYPASEVPAVVAQEMSLNEDPSAALAAAASYSGYLKANVEDPPGINVSSTKASIYWSATSSCVTSSTRTPTWSWYSPSGWSRTSGSTPSNSMSCSRAVLNVVGTFKNDAFCPGSGNTTYTNHSKTIFEGQPGGRYYWSYQMAKSGGCSSLLHYDYDLSHP